MHKDTVAFKAPAVSHAAKLLLVPSVAEAAPADDGKVMGQGPFSPNYFLAGVCGLHCARELPRLNRPSARRFGL